MNNLKKVNDFLTESKVFYLTTEDGNKPKCRPVSFHMLVDDRLYFGVGDFKDVYKQMQENPNVEFCATVGQDFLRYFGEATFTNDQSIVEKALDAMPMMRKIYNEQTGYGLGMFSLENATAEFRNMMGIKEKIEF